MAKYAPFDTLHYEGAIEHQLKLMNDAMSILRSTIAKGTALHDKLLLSQPNTVDIETVRAMNLHLHTAARNARHIYGETRELLDGIYFGIQEELSSAHNMDSKQYQLLKKLRTKTTNAKKTLRGYTINKMEEDAYKTVEKINKATKQHYTYRAR